MKNANRNSVIFMISFTIFLAFMDIKDLYYKIIMTGPLEQGDWSFTNDIYERVTDIDLTKVLSENNGTRIVSHNMWNALATRCDSLYISKLDGKDAHLAAVGTGCIIDGVKQDREIMFVGSMRIDHILGCASILGSAIEYPMTQRTRYADIWADKYSIPEIALHAEAREMIRSSDIPALKTTLQALYESYGATLYTWETTLCYEMMDMPKVGEVENGIFPTEYGCIWTDANDQNLRTFHIPPTTGKYFRHFFEQFGAMWNTIDFIYVGQLTMRNEIRYTTQYAIDRSETQHGGSDKLSHYLMLDVSMTGVLYYLIIIIEIMIIYINIGDSCAVAFLVIRPLVSGQKRSKVYKTKNTATISSNATTDVASDSTATNTQKSGTAAQKKEGELSRVLLYTDLSSVSFCNNFLCVLLLIDAIGSWLYVVPNSTIIAWSTNFFQLSSAVLSNFRIWPVVIVIINTIWRWTIVFVNERVAAVVTEFTYITSFEVMCSTMLAVYQEYDTILAVCMVKWGGIDRQREMSETVNGISSFYVSFSRYSYGDRSLESEGLDALYAPLKSILIGAVGYSILFAIIKGIYYVVTTYYEGTLKKELGMIWRTYERNSIEVYMNDPMRAKAIVRSQKQMYYRFGKSVYTRPFVYLEQNYNIAHGKFCPRPLIPFNTNDMSTLITDVNQAAYTIHGVVRDEESDKIIRKREHLDNQIPLS